MHKTRRCIRLSLLFVLATSTASAANCRTTLDNSCLSSPTIALRAVDCRTTFDARCLPSKATDAEIEADALASQRRIETMLQEQQEEAAWWDAIEQQEAACRLQAEWNARLFALYAPPATFVFVPAPRHWRGRR